MEIPLHEVASSPGKVMSHDTLPNTNNITAWDSIVSGEEPKSYSILLLYCNKPFFDQNKEKNLAEKNSNDA